MCVHASTPGSDHASPNLSRGRCRGHDAAAPAPSAPQCTVSPRILGANLDQNRFTGHTAAGCGGDRGRGGLSGVREVGRVIKNGQCDGGGSPGRGVLVAQRPTDHAFEHPRRRTSSLKLLETPPVQASPVSSSAQCRPCGLHPFTSLSQRKNAGGLLCINSLGLFPAPQELSADSARRAVGTYSVPSQLSKSQVSLRSVGWVQLGCFGPVCLFALHSTPFLCQPPHSFPLLSARALSPASRSPVSLEVISTS